MAPIAKDIVLSQPSQFQLALALAIAKGKPAELSIREYLHKIRTHILSEPRASHYGSNNEYLDAAAYWHDMFKESQLEIHELQMKISKLERVNDRLKAESRYFEGVNGAVKSGSKAASAPTGALKAPAGFKDITATKKGSKRNQDEMKASASTRPTKKVATKNSPLPTVQQSTDTLVDDLGVFDVPGAGSTTVLNLYRAHKLYQQMEPDTSVLAYHLTQAASNLADHISTVAKQIQQHVLNTAQTQDRRLRAQLTSLVTSKIDSEFSPIVRAAGRSFVSLFHGLATVWEKGTEVARQHHGATTYIFIQTFNTLLDVISTNCLLVAQLNAAQVAAESLSSATNAKKSVQAKPQKSTRTNKAPISQELTALLLALLTHLTPARQGAHTALFEGILYILLERTGKRLFLLTFGYERNSTVEADIKENNNTTSSKQNTVDREAIGIEVKFLVNVLERAMTIAPRFLGSLSGSEVKPTRLAKSSVKFNTIPKGNAGLSISAKEKLQRTLVECMFGNTYSTRSRSKSQGENESDTEDEDAKEKEKNNEFIEVLRKPVSMRPLPQPPRIEESEVPEWFTGEIWRLVGWDVLGWEGDW